MKAQRHLFFITLFFLELFSAADAATWELLHLDASYMVEYEGNLQPSGLTNCNGHLLMVSDTHDNLIFKLNLSDDSLTLSTWKQLQIAPAKLPPLPLSFRARHQVNTQIYNKRFDWEAITCDQAGNIYLASESYYDILEITPPGKTRWLTLDIYNRGITEGFFSVFNGGIEGLAWHQSNSLFIAAERNKRGLIFADKSSQDWRTVDIRHSSFSKDALILSRSPDVSGLWTENNYLFTLERNNFLVCRRKIKTLLATRCWSYSHIETSPDYRYQNTRYGIAEGIARIGNKLVIVVDNNHKPRFNKNREQTKDTRSTLFIYKLPENWLTPD